MERLRHSPSHRARRYAILAIVLGCTTGALSAQPGIAEEQSWVPVSDALEICLEAEEKDLATGHACIGKHARQCLDLAQREPLVTPEKCYQLELAAWALLGRRYFHQRPKDEKGKRIAEVQRAWTTFRDLKCGYVESHHGGSLGRWQKAICMMEETGRRAIDLRSFRAAP